MARIPCPKCDHKVHDQATSCPYCGAPMAHPGAPDVQTIEKTAKSLKAHILIGVCIIIAGLVSLCGTAIRSAETGGVVSPAPVLIIVVGLLWVVVTKIFIWWRHG